MKMATAPFKRANSLGDVLRNSREIVKGDYLCFVGVFLKSGGDMVVF
jgi:hypothetical protein